LLRLFRRVRDGLNFAQRFYLTSSVPAGHTFTFGIGAKGYECTVIVSRPEPMVSD